MSRWIYGVFLVLYVTPLATCCYEACIQEFSTDMAKISRSGKSSELLSSEFCRAMFTQVQCLKAAIVKCPPQEKALIETLLSVFIQPDYQRTCTGRNTTSGTNGSTDNILTGEYWNDTNLIGTSFPFISAPSFTGIIPTSGHTLMVCRHKFHSCQINFNQTFSASMDVYNISGLCQSLKQYTICFINLLSSECGHLVPRNLVYNMQKHYGGMCSNDAQANIYTMIECANLTMKCYVQFNSSFPLAGGDYNLTRMCGVIDNYTTCMQSINHTEECTQFIQQSLNGVQQLRRRYDAYCGEDNGQTTIQCVQSFQDCYGPFNQTFLPGLQTANLTLICSSFSTYASCVSRLTDTCSRQFDQALQSVQTLKNQFTRKCDPNVIKLATCEQVKECSQVFLKNYSMGTYSGAGFCGSIGEYFPCVERSLDACQLSQSTTDVGVGDLGTLMKEYCDKLSSNIKLARCSAFRKCATAIVVSFSPSIRNLYEGSTWCTFLQLSIGCAEHALQSSGCFLEDDVKLRQNIWELDRLRVQTCEKGALISKDKNGRNEDNMVDPSHYKKGEAKGEDAGSSNTFISTPTNTLLLLLLFTVVLSDRLLS